MIDKSSMSRRGALGLSVAAVTAGVVGPAARASATPRPGSVPPAVAWRRLMDGNARFRTGNQQHPHEQLEWRRKLAEGQQPFACVLGCADSRVSPELVFDHGLGDLFAVRAAGEVLDDAVVGSIEYAVEHLGVRLVVILGHERCGAVSAAVELVRGRAELSGSVSSLVRAIESTVLATPEEDDPAAFLAACVAHQTRRVAAQLRERSAMIREAMDHGHAELVPATYDLDEFRVSRVR